MSLITSNSLFQTAASGLEVQKRLEAAAQNIANSRVSSAPGTIGYQIKSVSSKGPDDINFLNVFESQLEGVSNLQNEINSSSNLGPTSEIVETTKYRYEYEPNHPDADENGMVQYPDVDMVGEMAAMVSANRLYETNLSVIEAAKQIMKKIIGDIMKINFNIPSSFNKKDNLEQRNINPPKDLPALTKNESETIEKSFKNDIAYQSYDYSGSKSINTSQSGNLLDIRGVIIKFILNK